MMDYAAMAQIAADVLAEHGQAVTLRNYTIGTYDPATGTTSNSFADVTRNAALLDFGQGQTVGPGGLIQGGDKRLLMEPGTVPALEDHVIVGAIEYVIKGIFEANPAGTPVLYDLHVRT